jgi:hypothetical protein
MDEVTSLCAQCGASVYRQHVDSGIARYEGDRLLCAVCVSEYEKAHDGTLTKAPDDDMRPIAFDDDDDPPRPSVARSRIQVSAPLGGSGVHRTTQPLNRALDPAAAGATRCRSFHSKLNEASLEFMNNQLNLWVDADPNIVIKFAASTIGVFEGKHAEPHLIVTVFY